MHPPAVRLETFLAALRRSWRDVVNLVHVRALRGHSFLPHLALNDRDWAFVQPLLKKKLGVDVRPWRRSDESWHFYRHSLAAWNLTDWEALEAVALAGKTKCNVQRHRIIFEGDERVRSTPRFEQFPH